MEEKLIIAFRPHHFLCTLGFQGKGYSSSFVNNFANIVQELKNNENTHIHVISSGDSICRACPSLSSRGCEEEAKVQALDHRHTQVLGFKPGDQITWAEAKQTIKENMTLNAFHAVCEGCEWKPQGMCEKALRALKSNNKGITLGKNC